MIEIVGALVGGLIGRYIQGRGEAYTPGWIMSIVGALILLLLFRKFGRRQAP